MRGLNLWDEAAPATTSTLYWVNLRLVLAEPDIGLIYYH